MKWLQASRKVYQIFVGLSFIIFLFVIILCSANWYVHIPSKCKAQDIGSVATFTYKPVTTSKVYLKLFYGVCKTDSTAGTENCFLWSDSADWKFMDSMNMLISSRTSLLEKDASDVWPVVKGLTIVSLFLSFVLLIFFCCAACVGEVAWKYQIAAAVSQFVFTFFLCVSLALGLSTDTVKPQMFGNYFYGCNVHAEPGASWWCGVAALVISIFSGFILMFPYLGGPTWVLKWAKALEVSPSDEWVNARERHRDELDLQSDHDPFAGIDITGVGGSSSLDRGQRKSSKVGQDNDEYEYDSLGSEEDDLT